MCLLALLYRVVEDAPVVVGANREEDYRRGGEPPRRLTGPIDFVAGLDPLAGGTWLGVNAAGLVVAVTNRRKSRLPARPRSRGILARELLGLPSASEATAAAVRELAADRYAGCNFLCADAREAVVIHAGDWLRVRPLPPGAHVLANRDVNDETDRRAQYALGWLLQLRHHASATAVEALRRLCASHEPPEAPLCFRDDSRGTVSSSILVLREKLAEGSYLHAQGPPDRTPYADYSHLLRELARAPAGGE
jgi:uncharacterized protein with NRDE domain